MPKIFISYRRDDASYVAEMLSDHLKKVFGADAVFIDVHDIPLGIDFRDHINNVVSKCDVLLVIIGDRWTSALTDAGKRRLEDPKDFVRLEIEAAIKRDIPVVPVLIDNAQIPSSSDLPGSLEPLCYRNAAELRAGRDMNYHIELLIDGLKSLFGTGKPETGAVERKDNADALHSAHSASKLRFIRKTPGMGMAVSFKIRVDGVVVGKLPYNQTIEVEVKSGKHFLEVTGGGAFFGAHQNIIINDGQVISFSVNYSSAGGINLKELQQSTA
jgi:hypothetical protein